MTGLIRLYFISWWRGFVGPFFSFAFPILILIMLGQFTPYNIIAPTYIIYCAVTLGIQSFSISLVQFRSSSLVKRIGQTPITKRQFISSLFIFNLLLILVATLWTILVMFLYQEFNLVKTSIKSTYAVIENNQIVNQVLNINAKILWDKIQWGWVALVWISSTTFCVSIGLLLGTIFSTVEKVNGIGLMVYFVTSFLGGIFFPLSMIKKSKALEYITLAMPIRYLSEVIIKAFSGEMSFTTQFEITKTVLNGEIVSRFQIGPLFYYMLIPFFIGIGLLITSAALFKWE